ncbi:MAG: hypothetical protein LUD47_04275 [Clostridia bacterium]|nr:hypothetical protein [Clostridia bacterium]
MAEDGILEKARPGHYNLSDCVQRYIDTQRASTARDSEKMESARRAAEVTLKTAKSRIAKMEADELSGKMHRSEDVAAMTEDLVFTIRSALVSLPGRVAVDAAAADTPAEVADIVRKEVHIVMRDLSKFQYDPKKYEERVRKRKSWDAEDDADEE